MGAHSHFLYHVVQGHFFSLPEEVRHFYQFSLVYTLLLSTAALFLPIYIYKETGSLFYVALYLFLSRAARALFKPLNLILLRRGVELAMFIAILSAVLAYGMAAFFGVSPPFLFLVTLLEALSASLYWDSYHVSFGLFGAKREEGREMARYYILQNIVSVVSPVLSSLVVFTLGFHVFYASVLLLVSFMALFLVRNLKRMYGVNISLNDVIGAPLRDFHFLEGFSTGLLLLAPLYLFLVLDSLLAFGSIKSFVVAASSVFAYLVGEYFDRRMPLHLGRFMYVGAGIYGLVAALLPSPLPVVFAEVVRTFSYTFHIPLSGLLYYVAKRGYPGITVSRSFYIGLGASLMSLFFLIATYFWNSLEVFRAFLLLSALFTILTAIYYRRVERFVEEMRARPEA